MAAMTKDTTSCAVIDAVAEASSLDPDVAALFVEVETILLEAELPAPAPSSAPSHIGCRERRWPPVGCCRGVSTGAWCAPPRPIRAVQRSPPGEHDDRMSMSRNTAGT
jgi:hypothetical protein